MEGTIHPDHAIALAPSIAALVAISGRELWRGRAEHGGPSRSRGYDCRHRRMVVRAARPDATWLPWLRWVVLIGSIVGAVLLVLSVDRLRRLAVIGLLVGSLTALSGTAAFTVATAATPHRPAPDFRPVRFGVRRRRWLRRRGWRGRVRRSSGRLQRGSRRHHGAGRCWTTSSRRWRAGRSRPASPKDA